MTREQFKKKWESRQYLGDGLYAMFDGFSIVLIAPRGEQEHSVALEPQVLKSFDAYRKYLEKDIQEYKKSQEEME